jgi:hypothetical protein
LTCAAALLGFFVVWHFVTPYHLWGDDWAGYVLQARAIDAGAITDEIARNARLLDSSDLRPGPSAYPWGFPALLWTTGGAPALSLALLKLVGVISFGITCAATFALARFFVGRMAAVFASAAVMLQPTLLLSADQILSDLPFMAISTVALVVTLMQWRNGMLHRRLRWDLAAVTVALTLLGYSVRPNGVVIPIVYGPAILLLAYDKALPRNVLIRYLVAIASCVVAAAIAYWAFLPDGSLYALSYLTASPERIARQLVAYGSEAAGFLPLTGLPRPLRLLGLIATLVSTAVAVRRYPRIGLVVLGCAALHLLLLAVIRFPVTTRYLFPVVPPIAVLAIAGAAHLLRGAVRALAIQARARGVAVAALLACMTTVQLWATQTMASQLVRMAQDQGPFSDSARSAFRAALDAIGPDAQVAFFKPRAFRLITGREAIVVTNPRRIASVPCHLLFLPPTSDAGSVQLTEGTLRGGGYIQRYRNEHFALFCGRQA